MIENEGNLLYEESNFFIDIYTNVVHWVNGMSLGLYEMYEAQALLVMELLVTSYDVEYSTGYYDSTVSYRVVVGKE